MEIFYDIHIYFKVRKKKHKNKKPEFLFTIQTNLFSQGKFICILKEFCHFMKNILRQNVSSIFEC